MQRCQRVVRLGGVAAGKEDADFDRARHLMVGVSRERLLHVRVGVVDRSGREGEDRERQMGRGRIRVEFQRFLVRQHRILRMIGVGLNRSDEEVGTTSQPATSAPRRR